MAGMTMIAPVTMSAEPRTECQERGMSEFQETVIVGGVSEEG
jgi:hypothetical protein